MEDIDGGLHPAVDGQSLGEGEGGLGITVAMYNKSTWECVAARPYIMGQHGSVLLLDHV